MANFKRKKCKRNVRCTLCTSYRWMGNSKGRRPDKEKGKRKSHQQAVDEL